MLNEPLTAFSGYVNSGTHLFRCDQGKIIDVRSTQQTMWADACESCESATDNASIAHTEIVTDDPHSRSTDVGDEGFSAWKWRGSLLRM